MENCDCQMSLLPKSSLIIIFLLIGCSSNRENVNSDIDNTWIGTWEAEWKTGAEAFPEVSGIDNFSMNGNLTFGSDGLVEIAAFGFPGCIFSSDTLQHQLNWQVRNDTLNLRSENDPYGIPYNIIELSGNRVELRLMEDITLTLTR